LARRVASKGARVALVGLEPDKLRNLAAEMGEDHVWCEADVTDSDQLDAAVRKVADTTGRIDVVVANAGIAPLGTVALAPVDAHVRTIDVNLGGVVRTVAATLPYVRASRGYLLLISSTAAFTAMPGMAAYCASKAGVEQFGNVLRLEMHHDGVRVGTAHPIWIDTDMVRDFREDLPSFGRTLHRLPWPLNTVVSVDRCADALLDGILRRRRKIYVPRSIGLVQALRTVVVGNRIAEAITMRLGRDQLAQMESEVAALGRSFGAHSTEVVVDRPL
jgi:NAD(P)-dependent dehydrogenase (short-subunit alcohol dehydrogenase family)